jgi:hypothetical protein
MTSVAEVKQRRENVRMIAARRRAQTHCKRGHEFTPENTFIRANGWRMCRTCHNDRNWYAARGLRVSA